MMLGVEAFLMELPKSWIRLFEIAYLTILPVDDGPLLAANSVIK